MLFNSNEFLFAFLPIVYIIYHFLRRYSPGVTCFAFLALASAVFYAIGDAKHLPLLAVSIAINYFFGRILIANRKKYILSLGVIANLAVLFIFKYTDFIGSQLHLIGLRDWTPGIVLPVGVSFFTFTQIAFLVDAYKGKVSEVNFARFGLFVTFFPHLIAGPILHHAEMMPQFERRFRLNLTRWTAIGLALLVIGLLKKLLIADKLSELASPVFAIAEKGENVQFFQAWIATLAYTFQIYFDFSAYSEMALGISMMFGILLPANFDSPYKSRNIIDFWRRWHITLSRFLREYLYIPLGGNRNGVIYRYRNLMITMVLGGIWHGAGWNFLIWGALHGSYLVINNIWNAARSPEKRRLGWGLGPALTFVAVMFAWVPFRAAGLTGTLGMFKAMFGLNGLGIPLEARVLAARLGVDLNRLGFTFYAENDRSGYYVSLCFLVLAALVSFCAPSTLQLMRKYRPALDMKDLRQGWGASAVKIPAFRFGFWSGASIGIALFVAVKTINSAAATEFLYFQF